MSPHKSVSKKYKIKRHEFYTIAGMLVLIVVMLLAIFLKPAAQRFFLETFIRFEPSAEIGDGKPPIEAGKSGLPASRTPEPSSAALQGSFTELFSGVGWKNPLNSTVHHDFKTLTVSFPPAYEVSPVSSISPTNPVVSGDTVTVGSRTFTAKIEKVGEQYDGYLYEIIAGELVPVSVRGPLFTSQYSGKIVFGSDGRSKIFLLYAAYEGKAFELDINPAGTAPVSVEKDYSNVFNARAMEEGAIDPRIFYKSGAWWIFSANNRPKLLRVRSGMVSDLTESVGLEVFTAVPAPEENSIYLISVDKIFRLRDFGFRQNGGLVWESLRINAWEGEIVRGRITSVNDSRSGVKYFLSNDGGRNWGEAEFGRFIQFETKGGDFRWRAEFSPSSSQYESPWIKTVGVEYYILRQN